ncbi:glycine cleavage system aminomethyltransferase GcvT [Tropicimonas sp. TH_r6]|uniref:glycine cleavage system aminomethyltransferase GcvT n=1 Tax=Tropicimonas sp. TH_r6 TaxID=3082085 RepID=UPI002952E3AA|nr:glycine cleavage system aminomethyltransferase GcvT [Tropicimonas sp. TH_r6]MDV7142381.1 glycine cleavage system aminomethyltransferase GcvT [Tropicimonas sp. TH_r6]
MLKTPLHALHLELGAKMVPFAGYEMPVQYKLGVMKEHLHTRAAAGLFDVSHMGQILLEGDNPALDLERLVPQSICGLKPNRQRYAFFTNEDGGIEDDIMVTRRDGHLFVVLNAACKAADIALMKAGLHSSDIVEITDRALLALQGPAAETALARLFAVERLAFMEGDMFPSDWGNVWISRSGYSGEDGFEISIEFDRAEDFARTLLAMEEVEPIGLGARDSLRLEAGLCLYGNDIDKSTDPVQANLTWAIQKPRRSGGDREGGFPGDRKILPKLSRAADPEDRRRVGLKPEGRAPMREGVQLFENDNSPEPVGVITSGAFGPTVGHPIAMGYLPARLAEPGTRLWGELRGKRLPVQVTPLPFRPSNYKR